MFLYRFYNPAVLLLKYVSADILILLSVKLFKTTLRATLKTSGVAPPLI